jgi:hypothetical protein
MPATPPRFTTLRRAANVTIFLCVLGALGAGVGGAYVWAQGERAYGAALAGAGLATLLLGLLLYCQVILLHKFVSNSYRAYDALLDTADEMRRQTGYLHSVADNSALSDWAKKIVYHEKDYEFLRDTIQGAIVRQDWEATTEFIRQLDEDLGRREEAERLRAEVARARQATIEEQVNAAVERFETLCVAQKWDQARNETASLRLLFPGDERIAALPRELEVRRKQYKRHLLEEYDRAVHAHEVDRAHTLLLELDFYLAPNEAAALKESARGVFKAKLLQMGVQFSLAISDRHFPDAIAVGERLIHEFPNSRYALEITQMLPVLQQRAAQEATQHGPAQHS